MIDILGMTKLDLSPDRFVPRMLNKYQKKSRLGISDHLPIYGKDPEELMRLVVTQDETWVYHFDPEAKKAEYAIKAHPSQEIWESFFSREGDGVLWDNQGIIMVDYLEEGPTKNGAYYAEELKRLRQEIVKKRKGKLTRGVLLLQDNAPANISQVAMAAASKCGFEVLPDSSYSPDLAPSDFCLFSNLKTDFRCKNFGSSEGVIDAVDE